MADGFRATIEGDEEFIRKLRGMGAGISSVLEEAVQAGSDVIADHANSLAPGPHIETDLKKKTRTFAEMEIGPDKEHWYYRFFETGTAPHEITPKKKGGLAFPYLGEKIVRMISNPSGMPAQPFLRPARDEKEDEAEEATGQTFLKVINKYLESR